MDDLNSTLFFWMSVAFTTMSFLVAAFILYAEIGQPLIVSVDDDVG